MAEIFLGYAHKGPFVGRPVVIKRILNEQREDPNAMQMLLDEAKNTATLMHPNVAQVIDLETDDDEVLLVIEFINGCNIEELVEVYTVRQEPLPLGFAITAIREAAQGLGHAHAHKNSRGELLPIVHRDVTPRNIMVDFEGSVKVLDFGIARAKGSERRTQAGMVRGTTAYMSPEQAIGKEIDPRTDLFSLGTIFHELLTGQRLFYKGNPGQEMAAVYEGEIPLPSKVNRRVPKSLDNVVMRLLERKLEKRYQTSLEMVRDLSLAAGSSAWSRERCAELVRASFSSRQGEVEKLLVRIPHKVPAAQQISSAPAYPQGRTIVSRTPQQGLVPMGNDDSSGARTLVGAQPLTNRIPLATEPGRHEPVTDPGRPAVSPLNLKQATPQPMPPAPPLSSSPSAGGLSAAQLFDEEPAREERTRILPGGSTRGLPRADGSPQAPSLLISEQTTDPRRQAVRREGNSTGTLIVAAIVALALGAVGGAFLIQKMQQPTQQQPAATIVRLSLSTDRAATVFLGKQQLGPTPINVFVPSGKHQLEIVEEGGARRGLEINLSTSEAEAKMVVTLDSLPLLP
jgi:serine/threonine protein kinase